MSIYLNVTHCCAQVWIDPQLDGTEHKHCKQTSQPGMEKAVYNWYVVYFWKGCKRDWSDGQSPRLLQPSAWSAVLSTLVLYMVIFS